MYTAHCRLKLHYPFVQQFPKHQITVLKIRNVKFHIVFEYRSQTQWSLGRIQCLLNFKLFVNIGEKQTVSCKKYLFFLKNRHILNADPTLLPCTSWLVLCVGLSLHEILSGFSFNPFSQPRAYLCYSFGLVDSLNLTPFF